MNEHPTVRLRKLLHRRLVLRNELAEIDREVTQLSEMPKMKFNPQGRLNENGRIFVDEMKRADYSNAEIARILELDPSTVSRR